ncbi:MAG: histidine phosphatase family protein [Planctomycetaceae bacterium]|nr:histidine phosphatase family protein [Planctomycetaceae bacterium]
MTIYLIRHGQSEFNAVHKDGDPDPMIFDAPLTEMGCLQAKKARQEAMALGVRQVITSPLTRAIQTALIVFDGYAPINVVAGHRELLSHSCDVGRPPSVLQAEFPGLSFDHLNDTWWHQGPPNENGVSVEPRNVFQHRIRQFMLDLDRMSERPLAVVGHGDTFRELAGISMENCEIRRLDGS